VKGSDWDRGCSYLSPIMMSFAAPSLSTCLKTLRRAGVGRMGFRSWMQEFDGHTIETLKTHLALGGSPPLILWSKSLRGSM
jgi:hypothetical protein